MAKKRSKKKTTAANIGFEETLWKIADGLRGNLGPAVYKHDVLGLIFLKYISGRFMSHRAMLETVDGADLEERMAYQLKSGPFGYQLLTKTPSSSLAAV